MQSHSIRPRPCGASSLRTRGIGTEPRGWRKPVRRGLALGLALVVGLVACSRQEEGARCSTENDDLDCESGLVCVPATNLRAKDDVARCCPPEGEPISDSRCARLVGGSGGSGGTGAGGTSNLGGEAGQGASATTGTQNCSYDSDCRQGLVCGPGGVCQFECQEDRDCEAPLVCDARRCVEG